MMDLNFLSVAMTTTPCTQCLSDELDTYSAQLNTKLKITTVFFPTGSAPFFKTKLIVYTKM